MRRRLTALIVMLAVVGACSGTSGSDATPSIAVTTNLLADIVRDIVGDAVEVEAVLPLGASPHDFQPSARQVDDLRSASAVISNGGGLEEGLADVLDAAADDGVPVHEAIDAVSTRITAADDGDGHGADDHDDAGVDPHFFLDPVLMAEAVEGIADFLVQAVPSLDASVVAANASALRAELLDLDAELRETLAAVPAERRYLVTNHDAFAYFAERYDFAIVGTVIPSGSTSDAASARDLAVLAEVIGELDLPAIFSETSASNDVVDALADEVDRPVEVIELSTGSLGAAGSGAETYAELLRSNARRIVGGLA